MMQPFSKISRSTYFWEEEGGYSFHLTILVCLIIPDNLKST